MKAFLALITIVLTMTACAVAGEKISNPRDMFGPRRGSPGWLDYKDVKDSICHVLNRDNEAMKNPSQKDVDIYFL